MDPARSVAARAAPAGSIATNDASQDLTPFPRRLWWLLRANARQIAAKAAAARRQRRPRPPLHGAPAPHPALALLSRLAAALRFIARQGRNNLYTAGACEQAAESLRREGVREAAVCGRGLLAELWIDLLKSRGIKALGPYDDAAHLRRSLPDFRGRVVVASMARPLERSHELREAGFAPDALVRALD